MSLVIYYAILHMLHPLISALILETIILLIESEFISVINCACYSVTYMGTRP